MSRFVDSHSSDDGESEEAAIRVEPSVGSKRRKVLDALRYSQTGRTASDLEYLGGGTEATRRVRELRADGWTITCEYYPNRGWVYHLVHPIERLHSVA
jgi:hypothetical protein